jgi:N,N'-diacetyllegionaminate synthase
MQSVHTALGDTTQIVLPAEMEQRKKIRRNVIATGDLPAGTKLTKADLSAKRPETGFPPEKISNLVGRVLVRGVKADTLIFESDLSE